MNNKFYSWFYSTIGLTVSLLKDLYLLSWHIIFLRLQQHFQIRYLHRVYLLRIWHSFLDTVYLKCYQPIQLLIYLKGSLDLYKQSKVAKRLKIFRWDLRLAPFSCLVHYTTQSTFMCSRRDIMLKNDDYTIILAFLVS